jgi:hypothetical protein
MVFDNEGSIQGSPILSLLAFKSIEDYIMYLL